MNQVKRQGMIDALLFQDLKIILKDLKQKDTIYLLFLLEERKPYRQWTDAEIQGAYNEIFEEMV